MISEETPEGEMITLTAGDGEKFAAYLARPEGGSGPGLVMIQEIFGINPFMMSMADTFASEGFVSIVPDLFHRLEPGLNLGYEDDDLQRAFDLYGQFDVDTGVIDIQSTISALREMDGVTGKVGAVGFCLGGLLAYLTATRTDADACVGYYPVGVEKQLDEADNLQCPLILHIAGGDGFCPPEAQDLLFRDLESREHVVLYKYDGLDHAFATPGRDSYNEIAAIKAFSRSLALLRGSLS